MDIEVVIKKSLVFAGMFAFVFGVVVAVAMLVAQLLGGANNLLILAISALIITFTLRPIEAWLVNATDKFLFQKKYEYKQILRAFIDEVITVLNLDEVVNSTLDLLDRTIHPQTSAIFILNKAEDKYLLYNCHGLENKNIVFTSDSRLVSFLKKSQGPAVIKKTDGISGVNPEVIVEMQNLKAVLVLPLFLHNDLIGFISLGSKKSDEEYAKDDLDVLLDLARTESVAVGNAQLLAEAAQSERRAAIGTMAAGIYHEIGNPLNIMSTRIQLFKLSRQKGLFQGKSSEEVLDQTEEALDECLKQSTRISEIARKLSNFAKPSREFKPEAVVVSEEIDEALAVVGHDLELERIKIKKEISADLPKILADRREIQQIFFNIIRNSAQAIEGEGAITIRALSAPDGKAHIEIADTGKGIPEDKAKRVFEPFFTTKGAGGK
jgi:K+-sensing histidine kinase KdpD